MNMTHTHLRARHREAGKGRIGTLFALTLLAAGIYSAYVLIPIRVAGYEFLDKMREEARFGAVNRKDTLVYERLIKKARALNLPLDPSHLKIKRDGGTYTIHAFYTVPVDLTFYKTNWTFDQTATAPIF